MWVGFLIRRLLRLLISLWVLLSITFLLIHLIPGDPVRAALGMTASPKLVDATRQSLGLDETLWLQYWHYVKGVITGDLGTSMTTSLPVAHQIEPRIWPTLSVSVLAFIVVALISFPLGTLAAALTRGGRRRGLELSFASGSVILGSVPEFIMAVALAAVFAVGLGWFPVAGSGSLSSYVLPVLALAIGPAAVMARIVRVEVLSVLDADFVRTARSKRLPPWKVYFKHALPNAATASLTLGGLLLSALIAGTVLIESVFAWPGLGSLLVQSILSKDYPMVQGLVLIYGAAVLVVNLIVDVVLALLDPRSRVMSS